MNCPGSIMGIEKQDCLAYPGKPPDKSSMVFPQLLIVTSKKAELSA